MCITLDEAVLKAKQNVDNVAIAINNLNIPCKFKGAFMKISDERGFRFDKETLRQMQIIGDTDSDICLIILERKQNGLISAYHLATELDTEKKRAEALEWLDEQGKRRTENNILKAILSVS